MLIIETPMVRLRKGLKVAFAREAPPTPPQKPSGAARSLAMGYRLMQAVESEAIRDYSEVARQMGVSQTRVSVLVNLTFLAPAIQEKILQEHPDLKRVSIHRLREIAQIIRWSEQIHELQKTIIHQKR
jgi:hypothetical protein